MTTSVQKHQSGPHVLQLRFFGNSEDLVLKKKKNPDRQKRGLPKYFKVSIQEDNRSVHNCVDRRLQE